MKRWVLVLVAALVMAGLANGGPVRADTGHAIYNGKTFRDVLVDEQHGRVFVTDDSSVRAFTLNGSPAGAHSEIAVGHLTMSPDGTAVVFAYRDGLKFLDPLTLDPVRYVSLPTVTCPSALGVASGLIFFSYGDCEGSIPGLGAVDLSDDTVTTGLTTGATPTDAQLVDVPGDPDALVASFGGSVEVLDTVGGDSPATSVRASSGAIGAVDLAVTPDGASVLVADGTTTQKVLAAADLAELPARTVTGTTRSVGVRADGMVGVGRRNVDAWDLSFYPAGSTNAVRSLDFGLGRYPAPRGLAFGPARAYVVTVNAAGANPIFHQLIAAPVVKPAITTDKAAYERDTTATVAVRVPGATGVVNIYETQYGVQERLVKRAMLDPVTGKLVAKTKLTYNTKIRVVYEGDDNHAPSTATRSVPVRTKLVLTSRHYSMAGPFHRVPKGSVGFIRGESYSPINHGCIKLVLSVRRADGTWRPVEGVPCWETTMSGKFSFTVSGLRSGTRARITASYAGGTRNSASLLTYYYLLFD